MHGGKLKLSFSDLSISFCSASEPHILKVISVFCRLFFVVFLRPIFFKILFKFSG